MKIKNTILTLFPLAIFLVLWEFYSSLDDKNMFLFASPSRVFNSLVENIFSGLLIKDFYITAYEIISGFVIGNIVGCLLGLSLWFSKTIAEISRPYVIALGSIPIFAIAPMMIIWFGTGIFSKIMMVILSTILIAITQSYEGAKNVNVEQVNLLKSFGASNNQIFTKLILPSSLLWVFNSLRLNISFAILGAFIAEFISANEGLGYRILKSSGLYDIPLVIASIILLIFLAFLLNGMIGLIEKKLNIIEIYR
ncbi:MAG: ABC transporter permease [Cellulophaga sp.]